jgi:hypothetical protein
VRRRLFRIVLPGALALAVVAAVLVYSSGHHGSTSGPGGAPDHSASPSTKIGGDAAGANTSSLIVTLHQSVPEFARPGGPQIGTVPGTWFGAPTALPVIAQDAGYLEVRVAQRPNGLTAWIAALGPTLSATPYRIVIDLATERLRLYEGGHRVLDAPAGIGTTQDPTPVGNFFVALYADPPSSAWGPFIMVTSGHSTAISDWEKSGDAIVAIHGPLGADAAIGTTGARVSHGCVRLHNADLARLRAVPAGSPVQIID